MTFNDIPPDILEHIAYHVATDPQLGPPTRLLDFILLSKYTYDSLSLRKNPILYARIFADKFDLGAPLRRLGKDVLTPQDLANELVKRFLVLKRFKSKALVHLIEPTPEEEQTLNEILWTAFLMVLENDGRNIAELRNSDAGEWLKSYWFDSTGSSDAMHLLQADEWPALGLGSPRNSITPYRCSQHLTLAMWLLWFFFDPALVVREPELFRKAERLLKLVVLNAPAYPLTSIPWTSFDETPSQFHFGTETTRSDQPIDPYERIASLARGRAKPATVKHFGMDLGHITPPPAAAAGILSYLALTARARRDAHESSIFGSLHFFDAFISRYAHGIDGNPFKAFQHAIPSTSDRWECEWERCIESTSTLDKNYNVRAFNPGSIDGAWEGTFTVKFHSFATLLAGAKPSKIRDCSLAEHNQTWRLREYHLLSPPAGTELDKSVEVDPAFTTMLPAGDPLLAYMPSDVVVSENDGILNIAHSSFSQSPTTSTTPLSSYVQYHAFEHENYSAEEREAYRQRVQDIILTGDGHSGWGEFSLVGRVRPCDGFVSILKVYTGGDRGLWLYRGFIIGGGDAPSPGRSGGLDGYIAGRWRDTITPAETHGYEGAFALTRRQ